MPATVEIRRDWDKDIKIRGLDVLLDGVSVGNLKYGSVLSLAIEPGTHELKVTNSLYSKSEEFTAEEGETVIFQAGNKMPAAWAWFLMMVCVAPYGVRLVRLERT
ncbi:MAG TPA: hypothetical protein VGL56_11785 [Fimbriimonadaceae bacterium]|jgi:hypothetical protein